METPATGTLLAITEMQYVEPQALLILDTLFS